MKTKSSVSDIDVPIPDEALVSVFDAIPDELLVIDHDYVVVLANRASLERFGVFSAPGQALHCYQVNHHRNHPCGEAGYPCVADRVFRSGQVVTEEHVHFDEFGNALHFEVTVAPIYSTDGEIVRVAEICKDISERKRADTLRQAKKEEARRLESLGLLAGGIAHDLNNLMMSVIGNAELALESIDGPHRAAYLDGIRFGLEDIIDSASRASHLAEPMLSYAGKGVFVDDTLSFQSLFETVREEVERRIPKHIVLRYDFKDGVPKVRANASQVTEILMNLLTNAADAIGGSAGVVTIGTGVTECDAACLDGAAFTTEAATGIYSFLEVCDNGRGMDQGTMARMFDPFFTTKETGRGLGLTTVLGIVRNQRGSIDVFSERGTGTTFRILFPSAEGDETGDARETTPTNRPVTGVTILVVDDDEAIRNVARQMLEREGFRIITANSAKDALALYERHRNDIGCVLLDLTMPEMDGISCFDALKTIDDAVRVILSSGQAEYDIRDRIGNRTMSNFIQKPYRREQLSETVKETLR